MTGGYIAHQYGYDQVFWLAAGLILLWLIVALTMKKPRHLKSLVVSLQPGEHIVASDFVGKVPGVFDVVIIPEHRLAYFKIDRDLFSNEPMEAILGRPLD